MQEVITCLSVMALLIAIMLYYFIIFKPDQNAKIEIKQKANQKDEVEQIFDDHFESWVQSIRNKQQTKV